MTRSLPGLPSPPDDDNRNSKKSRHLDDEPPDSGGTREEPMDIDTLLRADNPHASHASHANIANPTSPATFKDMLMGSDKVDHSMNFDAISEDDDIEILEGDVKRSMVDGLISIDFSERIQNLAAKSLYNTVVVKLLGRRIGYAALWNMIFDL
ncbi:hypothetical protein V6N12_007730 [Hibiscus sabdariffa]|uniref:Uncharacterized protein n=1 Tax=Hibiscus sabdariffa TaxID=183260 RepID=A0ABR2F2M2_9ROSI